MLRRDDKFVDSCNKYKVCPTYRELEKAADEWRSRAMKAEYELGMLRQILVPKEQPEKV